MPDLTQVPVGQAIELDVTVTVGSTPTDPTAGRDFKVRKPDGTIIDLGAGTIAGGNTGKASVVYDAPDQEGDYWWSFTATTPRTFEDHLFVATQDRVTDPGISNTALVTVADARLYITRSLVSDRFDAELAEILINGYSNAINKYCERQFRPLETGVAKTFNYAGQGFLSLAPYDLRTLTNITVGGIGLTNTTVTTDEYVLGPTGGSPEGTTLWLRLKWRTVYPTWGPYTVTVTGNWGITTIPDDVRTACLIAVADGYRNPEGSAGRSLGELSYQEPIEDASVAPNRSLPPDARALLAPFRRLAV